MSKPGERVNKCGVYRAPAKARTCGGRDLGALGLALGEDPTFQAIGVGRGGGLRPWTFELSPIIRCAGVCVCVQDGKVSHWPNNIFPFLPAHLQPENLAPAVFQSPRNPLPDVRPTSVPCPPLPLPGRRI